MMEQPLQLSVKSSKVFFRLLEYVDPTVLKELLELLAVSECGDIRYGMTVYEDILHSVILKVIMYFDGHSVAETAY